ncbi:MFS transporter, partial [Porticoccaceae bacterium]|nr:MFS transporter [Porticoccaceae bacterium]
MNDVRRVTALSGISYALPVVTVMILMNTNNVLSGLYATHYGLPLAVISMVMLTANLFDAVTDPTIGYLSDRYYARTGSRRPFIVIGMVMLIPSAWFLLNPGEGVTWGYFLFWYLLFYLSFTLFQVPHLTWGGEISSITEEKNKAYAYRNYGLYGGMILFALVPLMPWTEGSRITPEVMRYLVLTAAVLVVPTLYMMLRHVPTGRVSSQARMPENPFRAIAALVHNKPLMWFYAVALLVTVAQAFYVGVNFMAIDTYLGLGDYYVHLNLFHLVVGVLAIKPMMAVITRLGKMRAWRLSMVIAVVSYPILAFEAKFPV